MTREEAIAKLKECDKFDTEIAHVQADDILCEFLTSLGYADVVAEWMQIDKWYA